VAPARPVPVDPEEPFAVAAQRVLTVRAEELLEQVPKVRAGDDVEAVHDLRVAARRLRAVLEVFDVAFPRKPHRRLLRDVKEAADALSAARDLDVHLALLETFRDAAGPAERPGIEGLIEELRHERAMAADEVEPALDKLDDGRVAVYLAALTVAT
jgi:CHAD domain-containing protein